MEAKKGTATRSARTGSYTVRIPKSASTGKFVAESKPTGRIEVRGSASKTS